MKISDRFTDYGLIGGFFWTLQFAILGAMGYEWHTWPVWWRKMGSALGAIPTTSLPTISAVLGALALIAIFSTGLLLDLFSAPIFRNVELRIFTHYVKRNREWLGSFLDQHKPYIQGDLVELLRRPTWWADLGIGFKVIVFWVSRFRQEWKDSASGNLRALKCYVRIQAFLLSYVMLTPRIEKIELLNTQISLWTVSRAIALALMLLGFEMTWVWLTFAVNSESIFLGGISQLFYLVYAFELALLILAFLVVVAAFGRVCNTTFALVYLVSSTALSVPSGRPAESN
jgi:hypothetical protein